MNEQAKTKKQRNTYQFNDVKLNIVIDRGLNFELCRSSLLVFFFIIKMLS